MPDRTFRAKCPCCGAGLEIDTEARRVVRSAAGDEKKADPMEAALRKLEEDRKRLDSYFSGAGRSMEEKRRELEEKFAAEKKRIEETGDTSRPVNPMDLD